MIPIPTGTDLLWIIAIVIAIAFEQWIEESTPMPTEQNKVIDFNSAKQKRDQRESLKSSLSRAMMKSFITTPVSQLKPAINIGFKAIDNGEKFDIAFRRAVSMINPQQPA